MKKIFYSCLILAAILLSWFFPKLSNKNYGLQPAFQKSFFSPDKLNRYKTKNFSKTDISRYYTNMNFDFFMLQIPKQTVINNHTRNKSLPLYDFNRMLGISLLGHPLVDAFNPLNIFGLVLSPENTILAKCIFYIFIGFLGYLVLCNILKIDNFFLTITGALIFVLSSNTIHYFHWDNFIGLSMLIPWFFIGILQIYNQKYTSGILIFSLVNIFSLIINMVEIYFYILLVCSFFIALIYYKLVKEKKYKIIFKATAAYFSSIFITITVALPQIYYLYNYSIILGRQPESILSSLRRQPYLPVDKSSFFGIFGFPIDFSKTIQHYTFFSVTIIILVFYFVINVLRKKIKSTDIEKNFIYLFMFTIAFLFVGYLDLPLMIFSKYRILANQTRMLHILYFITSILFIFGLNYYIKNNKFLSNNLIKILLIVQFIFLFYSSIYMVSHKKNIANLLLNPYFIIIYLIILLQGLIFVNFKKFNIKIKYYNLAVFLLISLPYFFMGKIYLPFYSKKDLISTNYINNNNYNNINKRSIVFDSRVLKQKPKILRYFSGGQLLSIGDNSIGGYETGLTKQSAHFLWNYWPPKALKELKKNPEVSWCHFPDYWFIPDPEKFISSRKNNNEFYIPEKKKIILYLLGVSKIYSDYKINNLNSIDNVGKFNIYDLESRSPFSLYTKSNFTDIEKNLKLKKNSLNMRNLFFINNFHYDNKNKKIEINLINKDGIICVPFSMERNFSFTLDGNRINPTGIRHIGITMIKVSKNDKKLIISFDKDKINKLLYISKIFILIFFIIFIINFLYRKSLFNQKNT